MGQTSQTSPHALPAIVVWAMRQLPLLPLRLSLQRLSASIARRHPGLVERLEAYSDCGIRIAPTDAPFAIIIELRASDIALHVGRHLQSTSVIATIRGPLLALLGLADGTYDGDALFFSRDISVEGDIGAVVALRNAIDDAQIDFVDEIAASIGPLASQAVSMAGEPLGSLKNKLFSQRM